MPGNLALRPLTRRHRHPQPVSRKAFGQGVFQLRQARERFILHRQKPVAAAQARRRRFL
jgi:hypothetical protein